MDTAFHTVPARKGLKNVPCSRTHHSEGVGGWGTEPQAEPSDFGLPALGKMAQGHTAVSLSWRQKRGARSLLPPVTAAWLSPGQTGHLLYCRLSCSGRDSIIHCGYQLQVLGSLPNLWSHLKSLSFLQK